jgi:hypothetical protein
MGGLMVAANFAAIKYTIFTCIIGGIHHMILCEI